MTFGETFSSGLDLPTELPLHSAQLGLLTEHATQVGPMETEICANMHKDKNSRKQDLYTNSTVNVHKPVFMSMSPEKSPKLPPPTPGLSTRMTGLFLEEEECLCSIQCDEPGHHHLAGGEDHPHQAEDDSEQVPDECICSVRCEGVDAHQDLGQQRLGVGEQDECLCNIHCEGVYVHGGTGKSNYEDDISLGIKYCPGIEPVLPVYTHKEYKPRPSKWKFNIFKYISKNNILAGKERVEVPGGEDKMGSGRSRGENDIGRESFLEEKGVKTLIQDWERRAGGGEEVQALQMPSDKNSHRRVSEEFTRVRLKFVDCDEGGGMDRQTAKPNPSFASMDLNKYSSSNFNFSAQSLATRRKIKFTRISSMVRESGTPLAEITANGKRKSEYSISGGGCKKIKGGEEIMHLTTSDPS